MDYNWPQIVFIQIVGMVVFILLFLCSMIFFFVQKDRQVKRDMEIKDEIMKANEIFKTIVKGLGLDKKDGRT